MTLQLDDNRVLVRMYNVGFGDCFLVAIPAEGRPRKILFDCGSHSSGPGPKSIGEVVERVIADVTEDDDVPRIDVVVGTHRHQDHVSGFKDAAWAKVEVSEVWMPWTEHPTDPKARDIRERQSKIAQRLCFALRGAAESPALALAENSLKNAAAMATLHHGFAGPPKPPRFLPEPDGPATFSTPSLPGVVVHVMGPSRDEAVIRDMDPPAGAGYLRLAEAQDRDVAETPFKASWAISNEQFLAAPEFEHLKLSDKTLAYVQRLSEVNYFQVAAALESAVNGTSLMLALEVGAAVLLFPGDAQWGTWNAALQNEDWRALLRRTTFYKVGHHGSHNATPREYVEQLLGSRREGPTGFVENLSAAVSTRPIKIWKFIPKPELLEAIHGVTPSLARSDERNAPVPEFEFVDELVAETHVPIRPPQA
jgi:beta-lactamase superfamily II metal-dependent hydrolase